MPSAIKNLKPLIDILLAMSFKGWEKDFIFYQRVGRLATSSPDGSIHVVPVCYVYEDDVIYVATPIRSKKVKNLRRNPKATLIVDEYTEDWHRLRGIMVLCKASIIESGEEFKKAKEALYKKFEQYGKIYEIKEGELAMIKLMPEKVLSWSY